MISTLLLGRTYDLSFVQPLTRVLFNRFIGLALAVLASVAIGMCLLYFSFSSFSCYKGEKSLAPWYTLKYITDGRNEQVRAMSSPRRYAADRISEEPDT